MRTALLLAAVAGASASCALSTSQAPRDRNPPFTISVATPAVAFKRTPDGVWADVVVTIANHGESRLYMADCGISAQRLIDGKWIRVWNKNCLDFPLSSIPAGDSLVSTIRIAGSFRANDAIKADPRLTAGTYRLQFLVSYKTSTTALPAVLSELPPEGVRSTPPFEIRDP